MKLKKIVTVSLKDLFKKLSGNAPDEDCVSTEYGCIRKSVEDGYTYYDFKNDDNNTPCMDGESCEVMMETEKYVELREMDEKIPFKLSKEEFETAATEC